MENFQNENGPRLEKGWEPLIYSIRSKIMIVLFTRNL